MAEWILTNKDKLAVWRVAADVQTAWNEYSEEKLAHMWEYHRYCLQAALDSDGGNWYAKHRTAVGRAEGGV